MERSEEDAIRSGPRDSADSLASRRIEARAASFSIVDRGGPDAASWASSLLRQHRVACAQSMALVAWVPMVIFAAWHGSRGAHGTFDLFAHDYPVHIRALLAVPMLMLVGSVVDRRIRVGLRQFVACGMVRESELPAFERALDRMVRLRDSRFVPPVVLALALGGSVLSATQRIATPNLAWTTVGVAGARSLTLAGWWYVGVSLPLFQILMFTWLWRWLLWTTFLWQVSRLNLQLFATHSDRAAGLGFVGVATSSFAFVMLGPSLVMTASWVSRMLNDHVPIDRFKSVAAGLTVLILTIVMGPLALFAQRLRRTRHENAERYGILMQRYLRRFDRMWTGPAAPHDDEALGQLDAQNLSDLGNVYDIVLHVRFVPIDPQVLQDLGVAIVVPLLPMILASASPAEIVRKLVQALT